MRYFSSILIYLWFCLLHACPIGFFAENGRCRSCQINCKICDSLTKCHLCNVGFFLLKGKCYYECLYPRYPFFDEPSQLACKNIDTFDFRNNENFIDNYDSENGVKSMYMLNAHDLGGIEMSFWIQFQNFDDSLDQQVFFVLSNYLVPYQTMHNFPYITKFGLINGSLIGPTEINTINKKLRLENWYLITVTLEYEVNSYYIFSGIVVYDISSEKQFMTAKSESYPSFAQLKEKVVLHLGNLMNLKKLKFQVKNMKFLRQYAKKFLGTPLVQADLQTFHNYEQNFSFDSAEIFQRDGYISTDLKIDENFTAYLIKCFFNMKTSTFPSTFFQIKQGNKTVYSLEMILIDDVVQLKNGPNYENHLWSDFELILMILKSDERMILNYKNDFIPLDSSLILTIEVHSSIYSTKFESLVFMITRDFSIINIFQDYSYKEKIKPLNILDRVFNPNSFDYVDKICKNRTDLSFIYSLSDCDIEVRHSCIDKIPFCDICYNKTLCLKCSPGKWYLKNNECSPPLENLSCFMNIPLNSFTCDKCNPNTVNFFMEADKCISCVNSYNECNKTNKTQDCAELYWSKNCDLYDPNICPKNCQSCKKVNGKLLCTSCSDFSEMGSDNTCNLCPKGYIIQDGKCKIMCNKFNEVIVGNTCVSCIASFFPFARRKCPLLCGEKEVFLNGTCVKLDDFDRCIQEGPNWCEFCSLNLNNYDCRFKNYERNPYFYTMKNTENSKDFILKDKDVFTCPVNFTINPEIASKCSLHLLNIPKKIDENASYSSNRPNISRVCLEYIEGFYTIFINETCIYVPSTHHFTLKQISTSRSLINVTKNMKINQIKLTNDSKLVGNILLGTLYLEKCPNRFFKDTQGNCFYCGEDCIFCSGPNPSECHMTGNFGDRSVEHIADGIHYAFLVEHKLYSYFPILSLRPGCPLTCKSCYFTGYKHVCLECLNDDLYIFDLELPCVCKDHLYFDHNSLSCVPECPDNTKENDYECLSSCMKTSVKTNLIMVFEKDEKCRISCPEDMYSILYFEFDEDIKCLKNELYEKFHFSIEESIGISHKTLTNLLWDKGLIQLSFINDIKILKNIIHSLRDLDDGLLSTIDKIIQTITIIVTKSIDTDDMKYILARIDKLIFETNSMNIIWKIHYMYHLLNPDYLLYYRSKLIKHEYIISSNYAENIFVNRNMQLLIEGLSPNSTITLISFEKEADLFVSIYVRMDNIGFAQKMNISIETPSSFSGSIYFANFTSNYMETIASHHKTGILQRCIYFIALSKNFSNESFHALIDRDLFYGSNKNETEFSTAEVVDVQIKQFFIIVCSIAAAIVFIYIFSNFLKTKILNASKVNFIQMRNLDSDEEGDDDESREKEDEEEKEDHFRYKI